MLAIGLMTISVFAPLMAQAQPKDNPSPNVFSLTTLYFNYPNATDNYTGGQNFVVNYYGNGVDLNTQTFWGDCELYFFSNDSYVTLFSSYEVTDKDATNYGIMTIVTLPTVDIVEVVRLRATVSGGAFFMLPTDNPSPMADSLTEISGAFTLNPPHITTFNVVNLQNREYFEGDAIIFKMWGNGIDLTLADSVNIEVQLYYYSTDTFIWLANNVTLPPENYTDTVWNYTYVLSAPPVSEQETVFMYGSASVFMDGEIMYYGWISGDTLDFYLMPEEEPEPEPEPEPNPPHHTGSSIDITFTRVGDWTTGGTGVTASTNAPIPIEVVVESTKDIESVSITIIDTNGEQSTIALSITSGTLKNGVWSCTLPAQGKAGYVYYTVVALDTSGHGESTEQSYITINQPTDNSWMWILFLIIMILIAIAIYYLGNRK